ncbi:MAG TPA: class I SAM-dependent methyltransferase [Rhizomicrobium sp.]|nr:class I SAM-dependent methyltransferase [Rhizomicrobium sp.]
MTKRPLFNRLVLRARGAARLLQDRAYDVAFGIQTQVSPASGVPNPADRNARHEPISYSALAEIKSHIALGADDVFYDIGCGYGRALGYFAREQIAGCVGVELVPELARRAVINGQYLRGRRASITVRTGDAATQSYGGGTIFFMYNPFSAEVMALVLERINRDRGARAVQVVYANPVASVVFDQCGWLTLKETFRVPYRGATMETRLWQSRTAVPS